MWYHLSILIATCLLYCHTVTLWRRALVLDTLLAVYPLMPHSLNCLDPAKMPWIPEIDKFKVCDWLKHVTWYRWLAWGRLIYWGQPCTHAGATCPLPSHLAPSKMQRCNKLNDNIQSKPLCKLHSSVWPVTTLQTYMSWHLLKFVWFMFLT